MSVPPMERTGMNGSPCDPARSRSVIVTFEYSKSWTLPSRTLSSTSLTPQKPTSILLAQPAPTSSETAT